MDKNLDSVILAEVKVFFPHPDDDDAAKFQEINVKGLYQGNGYIEAIHAAMGQIADPLSKTGNIDVFIEDSIIKSSIMVGATCILRKFAIGKFMVAFPIKMPIKNTNMEIIIEYVSKFTRLTKKSEEWIERERREKKQAEDMARAMLGT